MVENRRAPRGDSKTQLIERKGERHSHRLVELLAFALMHDRDDKIVSFDLKLFERFEILSRMRLAHEIQNALKEPQAPRARVPAQIARHPGQRRAEDRKDQHAIENVVAIFVEERLLTVVEISEREEFDETVRMSFAFALDQLRFAIAGRRTAILDRAGEAAEGSAAAKPPGQAAAA